MFILCKGFFEYFPGEVESGTYQSYTLPMKAKGKNNGTGYMYRYIVYTH